MPLVTNEMNMAAAFKSAGIIPEVIPETFTPTAMLDIQYPKSGQDVAIGNHIRPSDAAEAPNVAFIPTEPDGKYTLMMIDPDAPSRSNNKFGPWRHWVVVNVPASDQTQLGASGNQLSPYRGPAPPSGTGPHRYIFLLFKQANENQQTFSALNNEDRRCFDYKAFANENNLELVGLNFFFATAQE